MRARRYTGGKRTLGTAVCKDDAGEMWEVGLGPEAFGVPLDGGFWRTKPKHRVTCRTCQCGGVLYFTVEGRVLFESDVTSLKMGFLDWLGVPRPHGGSIIRLTPVGVKPAVFIEGP